MPDADGGVCVMRQGVACPRPNEDSVTSHPPASLQALIERFDERAFDLPHRPVRLRLSVGGSGAWDLVLTPGGPRRLTAASASDRPATELQADQTPWEAMARDLRRGLD